MNRKLGDFFRNLRKKKGVSLRDIEKATNISNAYLSQLENDRIKNPSPKIVNKLANYYEVSYSKLLELVGCQAADNDDDMKPKFRKNELFDDISETKNEKLIEYLQFLRSKKSKFNLRK